MMIANATSYIVGATLAVAQSKKGRGKPCPYNLPAGRMGKWEEGKNRQAHRSVGSRSDLLDLPIAGEQAGLLTDQTDRTNRRD